MSKPCELEFVPRKRAAQDSGVQIGNRNSKSEVFIQSETALNAGETENYSMDQLAAIRQREHKDARYFWIPEQVQDEDFSIKRKKRIAQILERSHSLLHYCKVIQIARLVFYKAMGEVYDGFGGRVATPIETNRNLMRADKGCGAEVADSEDTNRETETDNCQC